MRSPAPAPTPATSRRPRRPHRRPRPRRRSRGRAASRGHAQRPQFPLTPAAPWHPWPPVDSLTSCRATRSRSGSQPEADPMGWWIVIAIIVVIALFLIVIYNRLVSLRQTVNQAWSDISVQLKQRHDLVPNLVETVKGYAGHERGTLEAVTQARNAAVAAGSPEAQAKAENMLSGALRQLFALSEAYPDLKASTEFPPASVRPVRSREQDRRLAPLPQQRRAGIQLVDPAVPGRAHRRSRRLHRADLLRPRRGRDRRGQHRTDREVLAAARDGSPPTEYDRARQLRPAHLHLE